VKEVGCTFSVFAEQVEATFASTAAAHMGWATRPRAEPAKVVQGGDFGSGDRPNVEA